MASINVQKWNWNTENPSQVPTHSTVTELEQWSSDIYTRSDGHLEPAAIGYNVVKAKILLHASQQQVQKAYSALTNHWDTRNFNQRVWNDLVEKVLALQIDWNVPADQRLDEDALEVERRSCKRATCAYISNEPVEYISYVQADGKIRTFRNLQARLWSFKFNLLARALERVLPGNWEWAWEADHVIITSGTEIKGQYILDLVRAINEWCDYEKLYLEGIELNFQSSGTANVQNSHSLGLQAGFSDSLAISVNADMIDGTAIIYQDIIARLYAEGTARTAAAAPMRVPPIYLTFSQSAQVVAPTGRPIQYTGSITEQGFQMDVIIGFTEKIALAASLLFQFTINDVGMLTIDSHTMTVDLNFVNEAGAIVSNPTGLPLFSTLLFTFESPRAIISMAETQILPDGSGELGFTSSGSIVFGLFQEILANPAYIVPVGAGTAYVFGAIPMTGTAAMSTEQSGEMSICFACRAEANEQYIQLHSDANNRVFHAVKAESRYNTIQTSDSAHAQDFNATRLAADPLSVHVQSIAEFRAALFAPMSAIASAKFSHVAQALACLHNAIAGNGELGLSEQVSLAPYEALWVHIDATVESPTAVATVINTRAEDVIGSDEVIVVGTADETNYAGTRIVSVAYMGFAVTALLSSITHSDTLAITLDPYFTSELDDYDVNTLETNFTV
jgi:hypothetical protein